MVMLALGSTACADGEPKTPAELEPVKDFLFTSTENVLVMWLQRSKKNWNRQSS